MKTLTLSSILLSLLLCVGLTMAVFAPTAQAALPTVKVLNQKGGIAIFSVPSNWKVKSSSVRISGKRGIPCARLGGRVVSWCSKIRIPKRASKIRIPKRASKIRIPKRASKVRVRVHYQVYTGKRYQRKLFAYSAPIIS